MGELQKITDRLFDDMNAGNADAVTAVFTSDVQGVDEISRKWIRGDAMSGYIRQLLSQVSDTKTTLTDVHESTWGDVGLLTCWVEQDYTYQGEQTHVSAPTSVVFRKEGGDWKMAAWHSIPLPEQS